MLAIINDTVRPTWRCSTSLYIISSAGTSKLSILPAADPAEKEPAFPRKRSARTEAH